jgi:hypothetical protein
VVNGEHFPLRPAAISILGTMPDHPQVPAIIMWNIAPTEGTGRL